MSKVCVISELLAKPFSSKSINEKTDIISKGRPRPSMPALSTQHKEKNRKYVRHFNVSIYDNITWLAGSASLNKIFCWPCLLFSTDRVTVWTKSGFNDLNHLNTACSKHEKSQNHIRSFLQLTSFGRTRIDHQLSEQKRICDLLHNEKVKKNRRVLRRLIDATCYLAKQELPFRGHDESSDSKNKGNYVEFLEVLREYDSLLDNHLKEATVFRGTSPLIQNDLICAVGGVVEDAILEEVSKANFVAILLDETSDVINKSQLSSVLRYVNDNGEVRERFLFFSDVSSDKSAPALFQHVNKVMEDFKCEQKLVAQTYDGAAVMSGHIGGLRTLVQERYPCATFVHCYAHVLNLTLQHSSSNIKECRIFFQTLSGLAAFFSKSPKRTHALKDFVGKKLPKVAPTRWNFTSRLVNTVQEYREPLLTFFDDLIENSCEWDNDTVVQARGFFSFLDSFETCFMVNVFSKIFRHTDVLYDTLQTQSLDIAYCTKKVTEAKNKIQEIRQTGFSHILTVSQEDCKKEPSFRGRNRTDEAVIPFYKRLFCEITDNILMQMNERFKSLENVEFVALLNHEMYSIYKNSFPETLLQQLNNCYGQMFDFVRLKNELSVFYDSKEFTNKPIFELVQFMRLHNFHLGMTEVYKLGTLILTIPSTTATVERTFSALKRIKSFCRATQGQERLSALSLISIEKELLWDLKLKSTFYDDVVKKFTEKERRAELTFK